MASAVLLTLPSQLQFSTHASTLPAFKCPDAFWHYLAWLDMGKVGVVRNQ